VPWQAIEFLKTLFETGASGLGWAVLGLCAASVMRWYTFKQMKAERDQQILETEKALDLQLKSFELLMRKHELKRLNGRARDGEG
jgi:hypothetical protein